METAMIERVRIVAEQHGDGFVAYPLAMDGAVVGQGDTADEALADARSAVRFHIETFGAAAFGDDPLLDAFIVEDAITVE
jgi:predicted RNase H-like HicB family nuclease